MEVKITDENYSEKWFACKKLSLAGITMLYYRYPTNNCQLASLSNIQAFLEFHSKKNLLHLFNFLVEEGRPAVMMDLNERFLNLEDNGKEHNLWYLKKSFLLHTDYISTNSSRMCMVIISVDKAIEILENLIKKEQ